MNLFYYFWADDSYPSNFTCRNKLQLRFWQHSFVGSTHCFRDCFYSFLFRSSYGLPHGSGDCKTIRVDSERSLYLHLPLIGKVHYCLIELPSLSYYPVNFCLVVCGVGFSQFYQSSTFCHTNYLTWAAIDSKYNSFMHNQSQKGCSWIVSPFLLCFLQFFTTILQCFSDIAFRISKRLFSSVGLLIPEAN